MIAVDSSVVIAAFASWHESHTAAREALAGKPRLVAHAAIETYSVLTRLPPPHRAPAAIVLEFIQRRFDEPLLTLSDVGHREFLASMADGRVVGGQTYDALIAFTAAEHSATLVSLDRRAALTYESVGVAVRRLAAASG